MGAWIEIVMVSLCIRKRRVAPLVGAWIEINSIGVELCVRRVAPLVGAWIEILWQLLSLVSLRSLPSWERGLKLLSGTG